MNELTREVFLPLSIERAWRVVTDPREMAQWFGDHVELELQPGGRIIAGWHDTGTFSGLVKSVDPPRRLVYRWCIALNEEVDVGPTTRVELSLTPVPGGVILRVRESGFGSLPPGMIDGNAKGWDQELRHLAAYVERSRG